MNKYHTVLSTIMETGKRQENKKGGIKYLLNERLNLKPVDLLEIFEGRIMPRNKLKNELELFMAGERLTERYREAGGFMVGLLWPYFGKFLPHIL